MDGKILAVGIAEAARLLDVCPCTITNLIRGKELTSRRIGRRRVIPMSALESFLRIDHDTDNAGSVRYCRRSVSDSAPAGAA
jgi:excisionase family DNA binding protein